MRGGCCLGLLWPLHSNAVTIKDTNDHWSLSPQHLLPWTFWAWGHDGEAHLQVTGKMELYLQS